MANFYLNSVTSNTVGFLVTGLTVGDTVQFYVRLADDPADQTVNKTYTATSTTMLKAFGGLTPNTEYKYNFWLNGTVVFASGPSFTTKPEVVRPDDWDWYNPIVSGGKISLSAAEWNAFCERINEFRIYDEISEYSFTYVSKGDAITAAIVNEAITAISNISGRGTLPMRVFSGDTIKASFFNSLRDALNAVP